MSDPGNADDRAARRMFDAFVRDSDRREFDAFVRASNRRVWAETERRAIAPRETRLEPPRLPVVYPPYAPPQLLHLSEEGQQVVLGEVAYVTCAACRALVRQSAGCPHRLGQ